MASRSWIFNGTFINKNIIPIALKIKKLAMTATLYSKVSK